MGFFGGPTDRAGDSFNFFACPLSKRCVSDAHLRERSGGNPQRKILNQEALRCHFWCSNTTISLKNLR